MSIGFFTTINHVLEKALYPICAVRNITIDDAILEAQHHLKNTSTQYYTENPHIDYNDPLCRWAYIYTYSGAHANLLNNAIYHFPELFQYLKMCIYSREKLSICALGGGPGSELLGIVKFIDREAPAGSMVDLHFSLIDKILQWDDSWSDFVDGINYTFSQKYGISRNNWPVIINHSFLPLDLLNVNELQGFFSRFSTTKLFILNHVISEVYSNMNEFSEMFNQLVKLAPIDALFLLIDRNQRKIVECLENLIIFNREMNFCGTKTETKNMDLDEQKTNLGHWYSDMGLSPKLEWNAYYLLCKKVSTY